MITEDYVSYEVAKLLKDKGFDEPCNSFYEYKKKLYIHDMDTYFPNGMKNSDHDKENNKGISAPTLQMACKWLREEKRTSIIVEFDLTKRGYCPYVHQLNYDMDWVVKWRINIPMKYEEAVEAALKYVLENLI